MSVLEMYVCMLCLSTCIEEFLCHYILKPRTGVPYLEDCKSIHYRELGLSVEVPQCKRDN
jgi:hypothetical protein